MLSPHGKWLERDADVHQLKNRWNHSIHLGICFNDYICWAVRGQTGVRDHHSENNLRKIWHLYNETFYDMRIHDIKWHVNFTKNLCIPIIDMCSFYSRLSLHIRYWTLDIIHYSVRVIRIQVYKSKNVSWFVSFL